MEDVAHAPIELGSDCDIYLGNRRIPPVLYNHFRVERAEYVSRSGHKMSMLFFPVYRNGVLEFYQLRSIFGKIIRNAKGSNKMDHLMNGDHPHKSSVVTEGPISAMSAGFNGIAAFGKDISDRQFRMLLERDDDYYVCGLDNDFFEKNLILARRFFDAGKTAYVLALPPGLDPNDVDQQTMQECYGQAIKYDPEKAQSLVQLALQRAQYSSVQQYANNVKRLMRGLKTEGKTPAARELIAAIQANKQGSTLPH
jgi:hypothetical protein